MADLFDSFLAIVERKTKFDHFAPGLARPLNRGGRWLTSLIHSWQLLSASPGIDPLPAAGGAPEQNCQTLLSNIFRG